jgi:glycosyltransferase involved in cell wall biosynthesis
VRIFLSNSTDIFAGGEDYVLILAKYLKLRGHEVSVSANPGHLLLKKCNEIMIATVPIAYTGMSRVFAVAAQLRKELRQRSVDIIHSNANYDRTCAALATSFTRTRHVAGVHSSHSIQHNLTHYLRNRWGIDHFVTDADAGKNVLMKEDHIPSERITTVHIGIENGTPDERAKARAGTRSSLGIADGTVVIGNVARLVLFKGHRYLLEAIAEITKEESHVLFLIIGDGELMTELNQQAASLDIEPYVRFLGFRDNLHEMYPAFDIYCHSSLELAAEMFPIAILRALASELPVVCTDVGGIRIMVDDGTSGYLTRPGDSGALAVALLKLIHDSRLRTSMGKASFALFQQKFHADAMAEKIERIYSAVLNT